MTDYDMIKRNTHELPTPKGQGLHSESQLTLTTPAESQHYETGGMVQRSVHNEKRERREKRRY